MHSTPPPEAARGPRTAEAAANACAHVLVWPASIAIRVPQQGAESADTVHNRTVCVRANGLQQEDLGLVMCARQVGYA
jgi:hypothetical protein